MPDDAVTGSGTVPDPIPEVRDEGPGGTDLNMDDGGMDDATTGSLPDPMPEVRDEGPGGSHLN